jgi:hypothetical protein
MTSGHVAVEPAEKEGRGGGLNMTKTYNVLNTAPLFVFPLVIIAIILAIIVIHTYLLLEGRMPMIKGDATMGMSIQGLAGGF